MAASHIEWRWLSFANLDVSTLYELLQLRQAVFNVEQRIMYKDADGDDRCAWHLLGMMEGSIVAYLRVLPPGSHYSETAIGRVLTRKDVRGQGIGRALVSEALRRIHINFPNEGVRISAQKYLTRFYDELGFSEVGDTYNVFEVPHIEMVLRTG